MRTGIEKRLLGHWYGSVQPPWYLRMLEPVYRSAYLRAKKRQLSNSKQCSNGTPLIVVGNITAGGSGKTPLVIRLAELAGKLNLKAGIASTGYGRQGRKTVLVQADSDTLACGDEPVLLARRTGLPVVVSANRRDAVARLDSMNLDLIFSDDGLQHADMRADIEICVVDGQRGLGNGHLLPAGPLRESPQRLSNLDHLVSNGDWAGRPEGLQVNLMVLKAVHIKSLDDNIKYTVEEFQEKHNGQEIHAYAGIGNPQRFFDMLQTLGIDVVPHPRRDHHRFSLQEFAQPRSGAVILMTEKDAVKCRALGLQKAWYVPVETKLPEGFESILMKQMLKLSKDRK